MPRSRAIDRDAPRTRSPRSSLSAPNRNAFPIVAVGSSAGGLDACRKLLDALPPDNGMAFILVQHLDPSHDSMMAELLAGHTDMPVAQAADGMPIERDHVYVIPPGFYLAVDDKAILRLSAPQARHGARLPFDFLLESLASQFGARTVCVVLSGTGADGSVGLMAVKAQGGLVIVQDLAEADYDGMPRSAAATGGADFILSAAEIAAALVQHESRAGARRRRQAQARRDRFATRFRESSNSCAARRLTISGSTSRARSNGASNGAWRSSRNGPRRRIRPICAKTRRKWTNSRRIS